MSAWAVGVRVSAAMASARLSAKVFTDASPISAHALGLNIERGHAAQAYSEKSRPSTGPLSGGQRDVGRRGGSIDDRGFLALGDGPGEFLFVADALQLLQGVVQAGADLAAGGEGGRQLAHALDDADRLVMDRAIRIAVV